MEAATALARAGVGGPAGGGAPAGAGPVAGVVAPAGGAGNGPAAGGVTGVGHAAAEGMAQAQQGQFATLDGMLTSYVGDTTLPDAAAQEALLRVRAGFKPTPAETFKDGPGDLTVLGRALETILKVATTVTVTRYYGPNEELGIALLLPVFDGDAVSLARTTLADTPPSDGATFRLHGSLMALLRAYLPPSASKIWRDACDDFVFPQGFSQGWTAIVRLFDLQCVIAELTATEVHYVKRLDPPTWGKLLQILEDSAHSSASLR